MADVIIYEDAPHVWHYRPMSVELQRGPPADNRKVMLYTGGVFYALDHGQATRIDFPVSRWKLIEIGLSCILAALGRSGHAATSK
jgi:hypothetical protein